MKSVAGSSSRGVFRNVIRGLATLALIACGSATAPVRRFQGQAVSVASAYQPLTAGPSTAPVFRLAIHSVFRNVESQTVYVHQWCDQQLGTDTTTSPWVNLARIGNDTTHIGYQYFGCYLDEGVRPAGTHAVAPGDSLASDLSFPAILNHVPTAADSATLIGEMRIQYVVTRTPAPYSSGDLVADEFRTSPPFTVRLPK